MVQALELRAVSITYPDGYEAVREGNLGVVEGSIVALVGASGSGKSTLLRAIAGLEPLSAGEIWIEGEVVERVCGSSRFRMPAHKRGVGMVFQDGQLFPHMNVRENVEYGLRMRYRSARSYENVADRLLELVGLHGFGERKISTLSGGQAQRVALARSLAPSPKILLLDEPLSALDADLRTSLSEQLREILKRTHTTAVYVTHDLDEAQRVSDRIVRIEDIAKNGAFQRCH